MKTKQCATCGEKKPLSEFAKNRAKADGLAHSCRPCHRAYVRRHYRRNKEAYLRKAKVHRDRQKELLAQIIRKEKAKPCTDCGRSYPYYVMDFDHVRGTKDFNIGCAAKAGMSIERLMKEIAKCELVCANCHRIRSWGKEEAA